MNLAELEQELLTTFTVVIARYSLALTGSQEDDYGAQATLANSSAALRVRHELRDKRFFLTIHRLDRGPIASMRDMAERRRDPLNGFDVDDLISLRDAEHRIEQAGLPEHEILLQYADELPRVADGIFSGEFAVFNGLAQIVAKRIEQQEREGKAVGPDSRVFMKAVETAGLL